MEEGSIAIVSASDIDSDSLATLHAEDAAGLKKSLLLTKRPADLEEEEVTSGSSSGTFGSSPPRSAKPTEQTDKARRAMPFSSSPVLYPASSSPVPQLKKRKLFQSLNQSPAAKKAKIVEGFVEDDEDEATDDYGLLKEKTAPVNILQPDQDILDIDDVLDQVNSEDLPEPDLPRVPSHPTPSHSTTGLCAETSTGTPFRIALRPAAQKQTYEEIIAQRSVTAAGRAKRAYYGIEIQTLMHDANLQKELDKSQKEVEEQKALRQMEERPVSRQSESSVNSSKGKEHQMWTEKYRAKKFTDLVGDERTHRSVLKWLKGWDQIVFGSSKPRAKRIFEDQTDGERQHRKILLLTGPPGLGKTTLAHVCARKAGYETLEINASDDRSRDVVKGRIKDVLGTETVRGIKEAGKERRAGRPVCVVVDEVDGVTTGSGGSGEGGFMKALIDLMHIDQHNSNNVGKQVAGSRKKKGDSFRMLRPLILVCNDVYAPSLRPLRTSSLAEIVHVRKPALDKVITRLRTVFDSESILCDNDAVRRICESAWGMGSRKQNSLGGRGAGEGDLRGILVQAEWMAHKFRRKTSTDQASQPRLTRKWVESQMGDSQSASGNKGLGRGGTREVIDRIFIEGAGLPNLPTALSADEARMVDESKTTSIGVADIRKRAAINALRQMVDTCGEHDRLMTECFATYPAQVFQDDTQLSKPTAAYDWLHFHDSLSRKLYGQQEWELGAYMNTGACAFHHLFASVDKGNKTWNDEKKEDEDTVAHPYSGPRADFAAYEAEKETKTILTELQASFSAPLLRLFSSIDNMATELIPSVNRMLAPDVKPVVIGGGGGAASVASVRKESEKACVQNVVRVMNGLNLKFDKHKVEIDASAGPANRATFVYRMEPPLDVLNTYHMTSSTSVAGPTRYAVRQVLDQELRKEKMLQNSAARHGRSTALVTEGSDENKENADPKEQLKDKSTDVKRDFFGRIIKAAPVSTTESESKKQAKEMVKEEDRVWVSFNEGFSNAVRKPITLKELMEGF